MYKLRKYHGDKVQSLTYEKDRNAASVGIIGVGEYEFGSLANEKYTVTSGKIDLWNEKSQHWDAFIPFQTFIIPVSSNFKIKADEISTYLCVYS